MPHARRTRRRYISRRAHTLDPFTFVFNYFLNPASEFCHNALGIGRTLSFLSAAVVNAASLSRAAAAAATSRHFAFAGHKRGPLCLNFIAEEMDGGTKWALDSHLVS